MKTLLHAGCGPAHRPDGYACYRETRLDCDPGCKPDIVASVTAMPMVASGSFDAAYCNHMIEHLYFHEVAQALGELHRVLKPGGVLELAVPDLQAIGGRLACDEADVPLYGNPRFGLVSPLDMLYGHRGSVAKGHVYMAHKTGFTQSVLTACLKRAGFAEVAVERGNLELKATATKGASYAGQEPGAEGVPQHALRPCVGEAARL